jgi:hypothetical protein
LTTNLSQKIKQAKERIEKEELEWAFWRPILGKVLTFTEACNATLDDIIEANAVLNIKDEQEKIAIEKQKQESLRKNGRG